jgi:hypothetical protein
MNADPTWRPGDQKPVPRDVQYWDEWSCDKGESPCAVMFGVEIRNRCGVAARFVIGPDVEVPPDDAPVNELEPGSSIQTHIPGDFLIYLAAPSGEYTLRAKLGVNHIVFTGDGPCTQVERG